MPSDANGVYSLPAVYRAQAGTKIQPGQHNVALEDIAADLSSRIPRSGNAPMTGPLQAASGSAAAPGLTFDGAEDFGFYKTASGIGVAIGGTMVAEFTAAGILKSSRYIGELFPWTGSTPPALCVFPFGQTLSRTTYAGLWAFAQVEIAAGNVFFNNGNGSTTFGIGDLRGRAPTCNDAIGGTPAGILTSTYYGSSTSTLGALGGNQSQTLTIAQIPASIPVTVTGTATVTSTVTDVLRSTTHDNFTSTAGDAGPIANVTGNQITSTGSISGTGTASGSGNPHPNVQPSVITNFALFAGA